MTANLSEPTAPLLNAVLNGCEVGMIVLDSDRRIVLWNAWMAKASSIPHEEALGTTLDALFPQLLGTRVQQAVQNALQHGLAALLFQTLHKAPFPLYRTPAEHREGTRMRQMIIINLSNSRFRAIVWCRSRMSRVREREQLLRLSVGMVRISRSPSRPRALIQAREAAFRQRASVRILANSEP
jgi:PAS domain-containing protein